MSRSGLQYGAASAEGKEDYSYGSMEKEDGPRAFDESLDRFLSTRMPEIDNLAPMKERISTLEQSVLTQCHVNETTGTLFQNLDSDLSSKEINLQRLILQLEESFRNQMAEMKKEYDHRFDLQCAENQRLQQHISTMKAETNQIHRKLNVTIGKLKDLQTECGVQDDWQDLPGDSQSTVRLGTASVLSWQNTS